MSDIANLNIYNSGLALSDQHNIIHSEIQLANTDISHPDLPVSINNSDNSVLSMSEEVNFVPDSSFKNKSDSSLDDLLKLINETKEQSNKTDEALKALHAQRRKYDELAEVVFKNLKGVEEKVNTTSVDVAELRAEVEDNNKVIDARLTSIEKTSAKQWIVW